MEKVVSIKLYGIGHALLETELGPTQNRCMLQSFSEGYTANHDVPFILFITKLYRVAWALSATLLDTNPDKLSVIYY